MIVEEKLTPLVRDHAYDLQAILSVIGHHAFSKSVSVLHQLFRQAFVHNRNWRCARPVRGRERAASENFHAHRAKIVRPDTVCART